MAVVVTINRPDVVALVEQAASKFTHGNKTEAIALALNRLLDQEARSGTLFGAHPGSVRVLQGIDLISPVIEPSEAEDGKSPCWSIAAISSSTCPCRTGSTAF